MGRAIGIDLGTTNSAMAILEGGEPKVIRNAEGSNTTPSVVAFSKDGKDVLVGSLAKRQNVTNVDRTIGSVKRHMGESWKTGSIDGKNFSAEEISARVLMKLKKDAEAYLGEEVTDAVITVPAYFNDEQRKATQDAGRIAGLKVLRIVNEPTAAALAYGMQSAKDDEKILVYDLGGGTFDVSLLSVSKDSDDDFSTIEVIATSGDNKLGGDDWDNTIAEWIFSEFEGSSGVDLRNDKIARQRVIEAAEQAKMELSGGTSTHIQLPYITMTSEGPLNVELELTRAKFEALTKDLLERTKAPFNRVLDDAGMSIKDIDHVVLVGGSTRMPAVVELVEAMAGRKPNQGVNPDEVVALGAAVQAGVLRGELNDILLIDVTPLSLGIRTGEDTMTVMIERNSSIPTQKTEVFTTAVDNQSAVTIAIAQGERPVFSGNKVLGNFDLAVLPAKAAVPQIEVTFSIDANGVLDVVARDKNTGRENKVTISGGGNLSDADIEQMVKDAAAHAEEDSRKVKQTEQLNTAERVLLQAERVLEENRENLPADVISGVEGAISDLKSSIEGKEFAALDTRTDKLATELQRIGDAVYGQNAAQDSSQDASSADDVASDDEDIVEAEVIEDK